MRRFYAIFLDSIVQEQLQQSIDSIYLQWPSQLINTLHWMNKNQWHITLQFFSEFPEDKISLYNNFIAQRLENFPQFTTAITHIAPFPLQKNSCVAAWLQNSSALNALHHVLNQCAQDLNIMHANSHSDRHFKPHITLARGPVPSVHIPLNAAVKVTELCFVASVYRTNHHEYQILERLPLAL
jgi:2'-5' RNA ligase